MVKSVVKPLEMGFLRESRVPKKSVFSRDFSQYLQGFWGDLLFARSASLPAGATRRLHAPKASALPVVTKVQAAVACALLPSPSHCHSVFLALSATGGAQKTSPIAPHPEKQLFFRFAKLLYQTNRLLSSVQNVLFFLYCFFGKG